MTQRTVKEMLKKIGMHCEHHRSACRSADRRRNGSVSMITKGGLNSATQNLAIEYAKDGILVDAVAPGEVDTPMHRNESNGSSLQPAIKRATVKDIVDAVLYLVKARHVSGEILHVDGAAPARRW